MAETFLNTHTIRWSCSYGPAESHTPESWPCLSDGEVRACHYASQMCFWFVTAIVVFQGPAVLHPCCSCLLPWHCLINRWQNGHVLLGRWRKSWHWRNPWDSWREEYSLAHSASILRYLKFMLEKNSAGVFTRLFISWRRIRLYFQLDYVLPARLFQRSNWAFSARTGTDVSPNLHLDSWQSETQTSHDQFLFASCAVSCVCVCVCVIPRIYTEESLVCS